MTKYTHAFRDGNSAWFFCTADGAARAKSFGLEVVELSTNKQVISTLAQDLAMAFTRAQIRRREIFAKLNKRGSWQTVTAKGAA